jgi:hypothetical protein
MILAILLFAAAFPSPSATSWMSPESFHLKLGMTESQARGVLREGGWSPKKGKQTNHMIVEYGDKRTITLVFGHHRLDSIRFELVDFLPEVKSAFVEERKRLKETLGPPNPISPRNTLIYDGRTPNIFAVLSTTTKTEMGRQGLGFLAVRYFVPPAK